MWVADPGVQHEGNAPRTRGIALWEDRVLANLPDGRVDRDQPRQRRDRLGQEDRRARTSSAARRRFFTAPLVADGKVIVQNGAGDAGTRGWVAALDVKTGNELWRWYTVPKPGDPGSETLEGRSQRVEDRRRRHLADRLLRSGARSSTSSAPATRIRSTTRSSVPATTSTPTRSIALNVDTGKLAWHFQYTPNDSWDFDEVGVHMLYDTTIDGEKRKVVGHYARNGFFYTLDRTNGKFIKAEKYVNDLNWTKGIDPKTGKPVEYSPKLDVQLYNPEARALRGDGTKRTCPTWHGGVAHQPLAYNPVKNIAYGVGTEGCFSQNGAAVGVASDRTAASTTSASEPRKYSSDLYYGAVTAFDAVNHKVIAKAVTDIEIRSGVTATAGGLVFTALQDGWVVAYNDETLEELWRFNVGTPLKGAPVTYAIGPKQYLAVQAGGRHLHPVKFDKLENSSYLFVFALN